MPKETASIKKKGKEDLFSYFSITCAQYNTHYHYINFSNNKMKTQNLNLMEGLISLAILIGIVIGIILI
jgi:hypothetical protein